MKHKHQYHHDKNLHPINGPMTGVVEESKHDGIDLSPTQHDVATRAYYIFLSRGSQSGCDIQHWQEAEAQLVAEHNCTFDNDLPDPSKK